MINNFYCLKLIQLIIRHVTEAHTDLDITSREQMPDRYISGRIFYVFSDNEDNAVGNKQKKFILSTAILFLNIIAVPNHSFHYAICSPKCKDSS